VCLLFLLGKSSVQCIHPFSVRKINSVALVRKRTIPTERPPLSAKLVPTFTDRGCRVVSATDPHGRILGFLDRSRYYFFQVAPQLYWRGWVDPVTHYFWKNLAVPGNEPGTSGSVARNSNH
jgi:hypothetical protein